MISRSGVGRVKKIPVTVRIRKEANVRVEVKKDRQI